MSEISQVVDDLRRGLTEVEAKLTWEDLPGPALEELKAVVDSVRTSLLAYVTAIDPADYQRSLGDLRLRRAAQVCQGVLSGVVDGTIGAFTPGFSRLHSTVDETLEQLDKLLAD